MPEYGNIDYWNTRYAEEEDGFDWLFDYESVRPNLEKLLPREGQILIVGCGNANFSVDLENAGFKAVHIDLSEVVIRQMKERYPSIDWRIGDVLNMTFEDESFDVVIDKSLIDTLLCYDQSVTRVGQMVQEIHRVLKKDGVYVTMSLHTPEEVLPFLDLAEVDNLSQAFDEQGKRLPIDRIPVPSDWVTEWCKLKNPRWSKEDGSSRAVSHTFVVCTKTLRKFHTPITFQGALSDEAIQAMQQTEILMKVPPESVKECTVQEMLKLLDKALLSYLEGV